ncbi:MAG: hypothetical protein P1Q69_04030 [Candidatus Thorarchaeota archaeon]|nr:hypothetical protein [Candidatus Thorarchaeota archaeon]
MPRENSDDDNRPNTVPLDIGPSVLAKVPDVLRNKLRESILESEKNKDSTLISSNTLANSFIYERWGIRSSQRRRYRNLFSQVRRQCRSVFRNYLERGWLEIRDDEESKKHTFGVYKFDDKRGNLILGFVKMMPGSDWRIRSVGS